MPARCDDIAALIEPWAASEAQPLPDAIAHTASCPACAARLAHARYIDAALAERLPAGAPPHFTFDVLRLARQERRLVRSAMSSWPNVAFWLAVSVAALGTLLLAGERSDFNGTAPALQQLLVNVGRTATDISPYVYLAATVALVVMLVLNQDDRELI